MTLGERIHQYRICKGLSGVELARQASVSRSLISQIEQNSANPSIDTLRRIAIALEIPIAALFEERGTPSGLVIRKGQHKNLVLPESNLRYELMTPDLNRAIEFIRIEVEPDVQTQPPVFSHKGEECTVVLSGQLHVWINGEEYVLNEGDSISFDCGQRHSFANLGRERVVMMTAISPPAF